MIRAGAAGGRGLLGRIALAAALAFAAGTLAAATADASRFHLDCSRPSPGDGSPASPLNTLGAANAIPLPPGASLLLKRGTECEGELAPAGGGSTVAPVRIGAYGEGADPKVIGTGRNAVALTDVVNLVVEDLEISNPGSGEPLGEGTAIRNGIVVTAASRTVENVTLRRLKIRDVAGDLTKGPAGSAGILAVTTGPPPIRFENLTIEDNTVTEASRSGIAIYGTTEPPAKRPGASDPWPAASIGVMVRRNRIDRVAGDGIVSRGTDRAVIEDNVVSRGNLAGRPIGHPLGEICNAGIWAFRANSTRIRRNEVFGMKQGCDGTGFDLDYEQDGTVIEQNYSHDNEGGFMLLCWDQGRSGEVRFNLSVNDAATINFGPCGGHFGDLGGIRFFNNTIVAPDPIVSMQGIPQPRLLQPGNFQFFNNLIYATSRRTAPFPCGGSCSHNLFFNLPASGDDAVADDPRLIDPLRALPGRLAAGPAFRLADRSPARRAGRTLPAPDLADYFGRQPEPGSAPAIGFDQAPARSTGPGPACRKARAAKKRAARRLRNVRSRLTRLRKKEASPRRIRRAARKVKQRRRNHRRFARKARRACRKDR